MRRNIINILAFITCILALCVSTFVAIWIIELINELAKKL